MNSETRTLIVVLIVVGLFACCCMCVPIGLFIFAPVVTQVQEEIARAEAKRAADQAARAQRPFAPPQFPNLPRGPQIPVQPIPIPEIQPALPPLPITPPFDPAEARSTTPARTTPSGEGGLASLSDLQRKSIYRSATISLRIKESLAKQEAQMRARGANTAALQKLIADQEARQERDLQRLAERHKISADDVKKIIDEGRANNW